MTPLVFALLALGLDLASTLIGLRMAALWNTYQIVR